MRCAIDVSAAGYARAQTSGFGSLRNAGFEGAAPITLVAVGSKARAALRANGGIARPLSAFPQAPYFDAGGEIIWIGHSLQLRHPRAALTARPVPAGRGLTLGALPLPTWRRELPPIAAIDPQRMADTAAALLNAVCELGPPRGFGALLCHAKPDFPLAFAYARVRRLAQAYADNDVMSVYDASRRLLGLGAGLTPSGDDLAGAALFGRRLIDRSQSWARIGDELVQDARTASHAISAALLADTVAGESFEPLHDLADALVAGDARAAQIAARALIQIGHASGWDMLSGFLLGLPGTRMMIDG
jgi:hypothetical protein